VDYEQAMITAVRNFIHPDQVEEAIKAHSLATIKAKLAADGDTYCTGISPPRDGREESWRISYLNGDKEQALIARKDVTPVPAKRTDPDCRTAAG
jgi:hypothetical protein